MISFGSVLNALLNFLLIALAVYFCIVVPINNLRDMTEKAMAKVKGDDSDVAAEETGSLAGGTDRDPAAGHPQCARRPAARRCSCCTGCHGYHCRTGIQVMRVWAWASQ